MENVLEEYLDKEVWVNKSQREEAKRQVALVSSLLSDGMYVNSFQLELAIAYLELFKKENSNNKV
jgi:hypothetical protein